MTVIVSQRVDEIKENLLPSRLAQTKRSGAFSGCELPQGCISDIFVLREETPMNEFDRITIAPEVCLG